MISLLVKPDLLGKSRSTPPREMRTAPPESRPAQVDFFHQRYDYDFWRTHDPQVQGNALLVTPSLPARKASGSDSLAAPPARKPSLKRQETLNTFFARQTPPLSTLELCTASLNVQSYNRAAIGGNVDHLGLANLATPKQTLHAVLLQLRSMRQDEAKSPSSTRYDHSEATFVRGMSCIGGTFMRHERQRIERRFAEVDRICAVIEHQLRRLDTDNDDNPPTRAALKAVRRDLIREAARVQNEIALLEGRIADIESGFKAFRAPGPSAAVIPPSHFPVQARNFLRGGNCYVPIADENEFAIWSRFSHRAIDTMRSLLNNQYNGRADGLEDLCSDIALWLSLADLPELL